MPLPQRSQVEHWLSRTVVDRDGTEVGRCTRIYADTDTGLPEWLLVVVDGDDDGVIAPLLDASDAGERVQLSTSFDLIQSAPRIGTPDSISPDDEVQFYEHYGIALSDDASSTGLPAEVTEQAEAVTGGTGTGTGNTVDTDTDSFSAPAVASPVTAPSTTSVASPAVEVSAPETAEISAPAVAPVEETVPTPAVRLPAASTGTSTGGSSVSTTGGSDRSAAYAGGAAGLLALAGAAWWLRGRRQQASTPAARATSYGRGVASSFSLPEGLGDRLGEAAARAADAAAMVGSKAAGATGAGKKATTAASKTASKKAAKAAGRTTKATSSALDATTSALDDLGEGVVDAGEAVADSYHAAMTRLFGVAGVAVGFLLGARSGRQRYEQIAGVARDVASSPQLRSLAGAAREAATGPQVRQVASRVGTTVSSLADRSPLPTGSSNGDRTPRY